jgi:hypothetical protein
LCRAHRARVEMAVGPLDGIIAQRLERGDNLFGGQW